MKEILEELEKCKQDPYYFYLNYWKVEVDKEEGIYKLPQDTEFARTTFNRYYDKTTDSK